MNIRMRLNRAAEIARARAYLERSGWPRLQMSVIVLVTGAVGLLASYLFRAMGSTRWWSVIRSRSLSRTSFLLQMWIWTHWRSEPEVDLIDVADMASSGDGWSGAGGNSGAAALRAHGAHPPIPARACRPIPCWMWWMPRRACRCWALALLAVAAVAVVAAVWVVWSAPVLMAELLVDAAIAGGLYRRMRACNRRDGVLCVRHTFWPLLGVVAFFAALGGILQHLAPEASTLMEALRVL